MKKIIFLFVLFLFVQNSSYSQTVYDDSYQENPNYIQGNKYLANSQYTSAINEFKKALRTNPKDTSSLIGLSNSYSLRAAYYNNTVKAVDSAISDLKSAIFFLKYFNPSNSVASIDTINSMEKNLSTLEKSKKIQITSEQRLNLAKNSRIRGEFAASAYDYFQLIGDINYENQANIALGDIFKIFNTPEMALSFYKRAIEKDKDNTELHLKLARTYEQMKDFSSSLNEYTIALGASSEKDEILYSLEKIWQKKVDESPKDADARANLGVIFQKQKRYNEALTEYQQSATLNPSNLNTQINIATLYQEQKKYDLAIEVYDSILKVQPYNVSALSYKADCLKALNRKEQAIELYKAALSVEPNNTKIKAQLFDLLKNSMDTDDILAFLYKNVQDSPMNSTSYYEFAYELHKANKLDDAIVYYLQTIKLDNMNKDAYINLSQAYRQKQNYVDSYSIISKAKSLFPDDKSILSQFDIVSKDYIANNYTVASNAFQSGDYRKAIVEYSKIDPPTIDSLIGIAASYQSLSDSLKAIDYYKQAMILDEKNADLPFYIASLYINNNNLVDAKQYAEKAVSLNSSNTKAKEILTYISQKENEALLNEAVNFFDAKKYKEAIAIFDKVLENDSKNPTVYYYRALCYDSLNDYENAILDYSSTIKYAPEMEIAYYSLAVDYDNLGKYKQAKENYKKYVEISMEDSDYKQYALQRIDEIE